MLQMSSWHSFQLSFSFWGKPFRHLHSATTCLGILRRAPQHWPSSLQLLQRCRDQRIELESWRKLEPTSWSLNFRLPFRWSLLHVWIKQIWRHGFQNSSFKLFVFSWGVDTYDPSPFIIVLKALRWRKRAKSLTEFWMLIRPRVPREIAPKTWKNEKQP